MNAAKSNWLILVVLLLPQLLHCGARDPSPEDARAILQQATSFYTGTCGREDLASAKRLFLKAADEGDRDGMFYLGKAYENGHGVEKSRDEAIKWYQKQAR